MDGMTLLEEARAAGLTVEVEDGDKLRIRGPRHAEAIAWEVLARKAEVLAVLSDGHGADADTNPPNLEKEAFVSARGPAARPAGGDGSELVDPLFEQLWAAAQREPDIRWEDCLEPFELDKHPAPSAPRPCHWCGSLVFWRSVHGAITCIGCHPPAVPNLLSQKLLVSGTPANYRWSDIEAEVPAVARRRSETILPPPSDRGDQIDCLQEGDLDEPKNLTTAQERTEKRNQMVTKSTKLRSPVKWHGGKHYLARWIIEQFHEHHTYVEPFGGGASVLLNKIPSQVEIYNDLDENITRLFRVLRDDRDELRRRLILTPYSEVEFETAGESTDDEIEQARRFFVRCRMSLGGRGDSFSYTKHRVRRGMADVVSGFLSTIDEELPLIIERLRQVQIVCRPATKVIRDWDGPDTLFYCDPPYLPDTRQSRDVYDCEMTESEHRELAGLLGKCKGKVVLSGYPSPLYHVLYKGWRAVKTDIANHAAGGKTKARKQEVLWLNYDPPSRDTLPGMDL